MPVRTHPGASLADSLLGRKLILGVLILCLGAQLAERFPEVILPAAATARSDAPQAKTQHLDNDAWHWFPAVAPAGFAPTTDAAPVPSPHPEPVLLAELVNGLYDRPPPMF